MVELVVKLPEGAVELLKTKGVDWLGAEHILCAVANGTPLPKGHGKIVDLNDVREAGAPLYNGDKEIGFSVDYVAMNDIPVLVEAYKESEE